MESNKEDLERQMQEAESNVDAAAEAAASKEADKAKKEGLTEEEVNKRVEAARKQEKDKLYTEISSLKGLVQELKLSAQADKDAKEQAKAEANAEAEKERKAKLSAEDRLAEQLKTFEERLTQEAAERQRLEQELQEEREKQELEIYRQKSLSTAGDEIIPDLVQGNSKEDIDRSVAYAKSRYQELFNASKAKSEGPVIPPMPHSTNPDSDALDERELQGSIANFQIDPKRYAKDSQYRIEMDAKRQEVLERVSSAYKRSVGR